MKMIIINHFKPIRIRIGIAFSSNYEHERNSEEDELLFIKDILIRLDHI